MPPRFAALEMRLFLAVRAPEETAPSREGLSHALSLNDVCDALQLADFLGQSANAVISTGQCSWLYQQLPPEFL
jgi:sulfur relay (sulfurtransferase) DsrF/TusC family protein